MKRLSLVIALISIFLITATAIHAKDVQDSAKEKSFFGRIIDYFGWGDSDDKYDVKEDPIKSKRKKTVTEEKPYPSEQFKGDSAAPASISDSDGFKEAPSYSPPRPSQDPSGRGHSAMKGEKGSSQSTPTSYAEIIKLGHIKTTRELAWEKWLKSMQEESERVRAQLRCSRRERELLLEVFDTCPNDALYIGSVTYDWIRDELASEEPECQEARRRYCRESANSPNPRIPGFSVCPENTGGLHFDPTCTDREIEAECRNRLEYTIQAENTSSYNLVFCDNSDVLTLRFPAYITLIRRNGRIVEGCCMHWNPDSNEYDEAQDSECDRGNFISGNAGAEFAAEADVGSGYTLVIEAEDDRVRGCEITFSLNR